MWNVKLHAIFKRVIVYVITIVAPFLLWLCLEYLANSITHRFDPLKVDKNKKTLYINQDYFNDYFVAEQERFFNTSSSNRAIHLEKKNRFRIFCLGGSTTAGYPYNTLPEYNCPASFPNYLRAILQYNRDLPEIEMLNLGSNAFNSLSLLALFDDVKQYNPDLLIIYTGHNEYFGPNEFSLSARVSRIFNKKWVHHSMLRLRQTYLYQGLRWVIKKVAGRGIASYKNYAQWSMKNTVAFDDPIHEEVANNFRNNLSELVQRAKRQGIKVVICTPISNLTFPPFVSQFSKKLDVAAKADWDTLRNQASRLFDQQRYDEALGVWKKIYEIDSTYADVHYYIGMNFARLEEYEVANQALTRALELDALPFRARPKIQQICREVAQTENVILADSDWFFRQLSGKQFPEPSLMLDHVHPNEPGYYYLALFLAKTLVENGVFYGIKQIQYPSLERTREVLDIFDFVAYKVEYDFSRQSYLAQLAQLNPAVNAVVREIGEQAIRRARQIGEQLSKQQQAEIEQEKEKK